MDIEKEKRAIGYLQSFEPSNEPYYLCYSGGKDSDVIRILAQLAGVKHEIVHNLTTVDAPETVHYVKSIPNIKINYPKRPMWQLIVDNMLPPTRLMRYCCSELKEQGGKGRLKITGVRWAESPRRKNSADFVRIIGKPKTTQKKAKDLEIDYSTTKQGGIILNDDNDKNRRFVEQCYRTTSTMINPIVDWTDDDVWDFLRYYGCKSNPLYQCGFNRIGCIGCPLISDNERKRQFALYPIYRDNYIRTFDRMLQARKDNGKETYGSWTDGKAVMDWWVGKDTNQLSFFEVD